MQLLLFRLHLYVAQDILELVIFLSFPNTGITSMFHYSRLPLPVLRKDVVVYSTCASVAWVVAYRPLIFLFIETKSHDVPLAGFGIG